MVNPILNLSVLLILGLSSVLSPISNQQALGRALSPQPRARWNAELQSHLNDLAKHNIPYLLDQNQSSATITITCLGDSLTASYPYEGTPSTYPNQLQILLDTHYGQGIFEMINRGVSGYRADQILDDMQSEGWLQQDQADIVLLLAGGNDLAQGIKNIGDVTPVINQTVAEMQAIIDLIKAHTNQNGSTPEVIVSAVTPNLIEGILGSLVVAAYNNALEEELEHTDLWFTSNWDDFYDTETENAKAELMSDTVHLNEEGYQMMAEYWFDQISASYALLSLDMTGSGSGNVNFAPIGKTCSEDCLSIIALNDTITLTADADTASMFINWQGACEHSETECILTLDEEKSVSAHFSSAKIYIPLIVH